MQEKLAVCVVGDFKYIYKYFSNFKKDLRTKGNYKGEIIILTSLFSPINLLRGIIFDKKIKILRFPRINFSKKADYNLSTLNTENMPNRHLTKNFQWHKLHLFNTKLKNWNYIFYIDVNMKIHHDLSNLLNLHPKGKIQARADGYPDYEWKLRSQFDKTKKHFSELEKKYNLDITNYFQTGILYYDTSIITKRTYEDLINLVEKYPISTTNEQGIMNLFFLFSQNNYEELPERVNGIMTYYYWLLPDEEICITKQTRKKYK